MYIKGKENDWLLGVVGNRVNEKFNIGDLVSYENKRGEVTIDLLVTYKGNTDIMGYLGGESLIDKLKLIKKYNELPKDFETETTYFSEFKNDIKDVQINNEINTDKNCIICINSKFDDINAEYICEMTKKVIKNPSQTCKEFKDDLLEDENCFLDD